MGSGESDVKRTWEITTATATAIPQQELRLGSVTSSVHNGTNVNNNMDWFPNVPSTGIGTFPVTHTVYLYQIECPFDGAMNWLEIDKIKGCSKCGSKLKAVVQRADYEVQVKS